MNFDQAFDVLIGHEGGYSNNSADPGGETMWGVTRRQAVKAGYTGDMRLFPRDSAKAIYKSSYWDAVKADDLAPVLRYPLFDAAVNSGASQAIKWLQRALSIGEDGVMGQLTMHELELSSTYSYEVAVEMIAARLDFMTNLPTWAAFGKGWTRRIVSILQGLLK